MNCVNKWSPITFSHRTHKALLRIEKKRSFLDVLVTPDEKSIFSVNRCKRKVWVTRDLFKSAFIPRYIARWFGLILGTPYRFIKVLSLASGQK